MARWNLVDWWRVTSDLMRLYHVLPITMFQLLAMFHSVPPPKLHNNSCHWVGYSKTLLRKVGSSICLQRLNVVRNHKTQPPGPNGLNSPQPNREPRALTGSDNKGSWGGQKNAQKFVESRSFNITLILFLERQPNPKTCQKWSQRTSQLSMFVNFFLQMLRDHRITWLSTSLSHLRIDKVGIIWKKASASEISKRRNFQGLQSKIVSTHPYTTPQAIPEANYERNPYPGPQKYGTNQVFFGKKLYSPKQQIFCFVSVRVYPPSKRSCLNQRLFQHTFGTHP